MSARKPFEQERARITILFAYSMAMLLFMFFAFAYQEDWAVMTAWLICTFVASNLLKTAGRQ